jgi:hypothetical protein
MIGHQTVSLDSAHQMPVAFPTVAATGGGGWEQNHPTQKNQSSSWVA